MATNLSTLLAERDAAGARYAAAVAELRDAYVELASIDRVLLNRNVGYAAQVRTFHGFPSTLEQPFSHPVYAADVWQRLDFRTDAVAATKLAAFLAAQS